MLSFEIVFDENNLDNLAILKILVQTKNELTPKNKLTQGLTTVIELHNKLKTE